MTAAFTNRALATQRIPRAAECPAESDQLQMQVRHQLRIFAEDRVYPPVRLLASANPPDARENPSNVGVDREVGLSEGEEQDDPCGLPPHAGEGEKPSQRVLELQRFKERQTHPALLGLDVSEGFPDGVGLLLLKPPAANGVRDLALFGFGDRLDCPKSVDEGSVGTVAVRVGRVLGQDRQNERLHRTPLALGSRSEVLREPIDDPSGFARAIHRTRRIEDELACAQLVFKRESRIRFSSGGIMIVARGKRQIILRMVDGEDLLSQLLSVSVEGAVIVGGVGMIRDARLGYWNGLAYEEHVVTEPVELLALQGNIALRDGERMAHCHVTIARRDGTATGGHLMAATVANTAEIVLDLLEGITLERRAEPSGLVGLYPSP